jgi:alkanesulfonate monooxygenase SsuD/methylene tetrahydromethanopterin reductase-like flavin-dependent oxidoreductase (luciferase family)
VGGRPDDYEASGADFASRGRTFERQLAELGSVWSARAVGPAPANGRRPSLLVGGSSDIAYRRAAEHADGWTMGGGTPEMFGEALKKLEAAWSAAGREDEPRTLALFYFALGNDAERIAGEKLGDYYAFLGDYAQQVVQSAATDEQTIKSYLSAFDEAGADEVICFPASHDPSQVELLARAVGL